MSDDKASLEHRVMAFQMMQLPGQPQMMHIGTMSLVLDLYKEVQRLQAELEAQELEEMNK